MAELITASQYNTAKQANRKTLVKIDLLNFDYFVVDSLEGYGLGGSISINANSDIRRTCNISFIVNDSTFEIKSGGEIWLDKLVKIYLGIEDIKTSEISWTDMGIFLINQPTYTYDAQTKTMSIQGVDLMARLTGLRSGIIKEISESGYALIPVGTNVREAIIGILTENNFINYFVSECLNIDGEIQNVPYDMKFEQGSTWYDILLELKNILPHYQMYFDVNGVFRYEPIPYNATDPIMIDEDIWDNNVLSETINVDFESVKNVVEVWGRVHETEYYSDSTTTTIVSTTQIKPTWANLVSLEDYTVTALTLPQALNGEELFINFLGIFPIKDSSNNNITSLEADTYYTFSYIPDGYWLFLGGEQAFAVYKDENPDSPFYVGGSIGEIREVLYGNEYENIVSNDLALQRAKYEIYKRCRLNDTINLTTVPIYWADVNWKVAYTPLGENSSYEYMIQTIQIPLSVKNTQSFNLSRFYPLYPII